VVDHFQRGDEAVALARHRLDVNRLIRGVAEGLPQFLERCVYAGIEVNMSISGPQALAEFLASDQVAGTLNQQRKNLEGLLLQADALTTTTEKAGAKIGFKLAETDDSYWMNRAIHNCLPVSESAFEAIPICASWEPR
jgi:hypothetical protein